MICDGQDADRRTRSSCRLAPTLHPPLAWQSPSGSTRSARGGSKRTSTASSPSKQDKYFFANPKAPIVSLLGTRTAQRHLPRPDMALRPPQHPQFIQGHAQPPSTFPDFPRLCSPQPHPVDMDILPATPFASPIVELRRPARQPPHPLIEHRRTSCHTRRLNYRPPSPSRSSARRRSTRRSQQRASSPPPTPRTPLPSTTLFTYTTSAQTLRVQCPPH